MIVGSGAVGLTMAIDLSRRGRKVTVLEAGGRKLESASQAFFSAAEWCGMPLPGLHQGRFRMLGGTTNFWGGQLVQFDPVVFRSRQWVSEVSWPMSSEHLEQYYDRARMLLGLPNVLAGSDLWKAINVVPPDPHDEIESFFSAWIGQPNFAQLFASDLASNVDLQVFVNAPVVQLETERGDARVTGVWVRSDDGRTTLVRANHVVLANGTIEITRLLKQRTSGGEQPSWVHNRWLGHGFMDHVDAYAGQVQPIDKRRFHDLFDNVYHGSIKYTPKLKLSERSQRERSLLGIAAHFLFRSSLESHVANLKNAVKTVMVSGFQREVISWATLKSGLALLRILGPMSLRYLRDQRIYNLADGGITLRLTSEHAPRYESALRMTDREDELGLPIVSVDWRVPEETVVTMSHFARLLRDYLREGRLADLALDSALEAAAPSFLKKCDDANHHMGMARMAAAASDGVVDPELKVFGSSNLYVAGAAVFPTSGFANPTFTAIALGLGLSDRLAAQ
nr:FAD-dependent oxidoreductase [Bradyrhizobium ottawaense]